MILEVDGLTHQYGRDVAVRDVSFGVEAGELVAVLGPSGCGKTTIVQAIAGHVRPTAGRIRLRDRDVTDAKPEERRVGLVFQHSTLFPHLTVAENVAYGLQARDVDPGEQRDIVTEYLELVDLPDRREASPNELSGGEKRRVELARALAPQPDVLLLDEPLSALDRSLREGLREEIARIQAETGVTTLFVTHDQEEAMSLADRLIVMNDGGVVGIGTPRELYETPPSPFVASFLGRSNTLDADVVSRSPLHVDIDDRERAVRSTGIETPVGGTVTCLIRPSDITLGMPSNSGSEISLSGTATRIADVGPRHDVTVELDTGEQLLVEHRSTPPREGDRVQIVFDPDDVLLFDDF